MIAFFDGAFMPKEEAKIPISDRGFLYGDGVRATIKVERGEPLFLLDHLARLAEQCANIQLIPPRIEEKWVYELIEKNEAFEGIWRLKIIVTGGDDPSFHLPKRRWGHLALTLTPFTPPEEMKPFSVGLFPTPVMACHSSFKSLAHLNRFYVLDYAYKHGYDDCISLTESRLVLETAFGNIFWKVGEVCEIPDPSLPLYFGVTLQKVCEAIEKMGVALSFVKKKPEEIPKEASVYRTSTMLGLTPIISIEKRIFSREGDFEQAISQSLTQNAVAKRS